jgi:hypothetical protein
MTALRQLPRDASHKTGKCQTRYDIHRIPADVRGSWRDIAEMLGSRLMILDRWRVTEILELLDPKNLARVTSPETGPTRPTSRHPMEVGLSEAIVQLKEDARFWPTETDGQTRLVLLVHIKRRQKILQLKR